MNLIKQTAKGLQNKQRSDPTNQRKVGSREITTGTVLGICQRKTQDVVENLRIYHSFINFKENLK